MASKRTALHSLMNEYKDEIDLARKKFRKEQPETSHESVKTDFTHIIFYESFESYPITLEGGFKIFPKRWALAFLQPDIKSTAEILCESIFTMDDLRKRNSSGDDGVKKLPNIKKIAIQRAAKWLMNKNQDPWSFKPSTWPNNEEKEAIAETFATFNRIDSIQVHEIVGNASDNDDDDDAFVANAIGAQSSLTPPLTPVNAGYEDILEDLVLDFSYCSSFAKVIKLGKSGKRTYLGNPAQTAKKLTKMVILQNNDIFVDAVQFSYHRWACAVLGDTIEEIVEPLFRKYWKIDFLVPEVPFRSMDDLSPPKVLALIRAVAWIKLLKAEGRWEDSTGFDSAIPDHNVYLSTPEINQIYNYISIKYGSGPCRPLVEEFEKPVSPKSQPADPTLQSEPQQMRFTCIVPPTPIMTSADRNVSSPSPSPSMMHLTQPTIPVNAQGNVKIRGHTIKSSAWTEAIKRFRMDEKSGAEKAGKFLFEEIFRSEEIQDQNISGRGSREQFNQNKMEALFEALEYMRSIVMRQGNIVPWTKSEKKELTTKIFTEHANYLRRKLKVQAEISRQANAFT
ncbi:uncharacterized protein LOC110847099 [Folsomia candida]|uniref:Vacuolar amino acid transporter 2 n=1 Tax=Folsomia candida TaxID=158441 RepID=A0A226EMG6_FOLCA|nr:uncharacterized protein LOC110847099 [Folsomia candida]OXA58388.1 Vacuolar amino acid transporter 2 [Folsomia candida]